jgi:hypothetical protein
MQVTITIDPKNLPKPTTHPNVQVWANESGESVHSMGQTTLEQARRIIIDSGSGSRVRLSEAGENQFMLTFE